MHESSAPTARVVRRAEDGASAAEYSLLIAGIAALVVALVLGLGGLTARSFNATCQGLKGHGTPAAGTCTGS